MNTLTLITTARSASASEAVRPTPSAVTSARTLWSLTALSAAMLAVFAAAALLDTRTLDGDDVWLKPAKFALSFVVLYATMALVVERLSAPVREGAGMRATLVVMIVATAVEMAYIAVQAARGVHSHFNLATPFEAAMYTVMGVGAVALVAGIGVVGALAARDRGAELGPGLRAGVGWGFVLSAVLTFVVAGTLGSQGSHFVGTPSPGAAAIPLVGWSAEVGDLRPAHFLALHAMQVLPLLGLWLDRRGLAARAPIRRAAAAYAALTAAVFVQALLGLPLVRL